MNIGVLIYTHNRVDDAKINQEIIRNVWQKSNQFSEITIVHAFNGDPASYPQKYLENELVTTSNSGHFCGAANLIDLGFSKYMTDYPNIDYLVILAADTWVVKPETISNYCQRLKQENKYLAASSWSNLPPNTPDSILKGVSTDFLILDFQWAVKNQILPMNYQNFWDKYQDIFYYQQGMPSVEKLFLSKFIKSIHQQSQSDVEMRQIAVSKIINISEREPVHTEINTQGFYVRQMYWPEIGVLTHHNPIEKQAIIKSLNLDVGSNWQKLAQSADLSYYNQGFVSYQKTN